MITVSTPPEVTGVATADSGSLPRCCRAGLVVVVDGDGKRSWAAAAAAVLVAVVAMDLEEEVESGEK
jgi:hypothetical protein